MAKKKVTTLVTLSGNALKLVASEQAKYSSQDLIRGKSKVINTLLNKLYELEQNKK